MSENKKEPQEELQAEPTYCVNCKYCKLYATKYMCIAKTKKIDQ